MMPLMPLMTINALPNMSLMELMPLMPLTQLMLMSKNSNLCRHTYVGRKVKIVGMRGGGPPFINGTKAINAVNAINDD